MVTVVYADLLFFINFSMDFITLWIAALITSQNRSALRLSLAAAAGGIYGVLSVILSVSGPLTYIFAAAVSFLMCIIAFGFSGGILSLIRQGLIIWASGALLGGIMTAVLSMGGTVDASSPSAGTAALICAVGVILSYVFVRLICLFKGKRSASVTVSYKSRTVTFPALCDSGNLMRDPLSGAAVMPVSSEYVEKLCGKDLCEALLSVDTHILEKEKLSLRLIPSKGRDFETIIAGFIPDSVTVISGKRKKKVHCVIAPKKCKKDYFAGYGATLPTSLLP